MRWLIVLLIVALVLSDLLGTGMSLGPGLSVKNAILYLLALALVARLTLSDRLRLEMPAVLIGFAILIGYAIFSWLAAGVVIRYPRYDLLESAISLKSLLVDPALFFFSAFFALRTSADVRAVLRAFALAFTAANFFTITDVIGVTDFGVQIGSRGAEAGRVFGVFGHANETAGLIVCLLPCIAALAITSRGMVRLVWCAAAAVSLAVLIMTVSRGAFLAAGLGTIWAVYVCRRAISFRLVVRGAAIGAVCLVVVLALVAVLNPDSGAIVRERVLAESTAGDIEEVSSGRTAIWSEAIERMMESPVTLLTGFGWDVYESMPFRYATHNHYLNLWFNLGIPGVAIFVFMLAYVIVMARRALEAPATELRPYLVAFIFGMLPLTIAIFFGNQVNTWPYVWIYIGIVMRAAVLTLASARHALASKHGPATRPLRRPLTTSSHRPVATRRPSNFPPAAGS